MSRTRTMIVLGLAIASIGAPAAQAAAPSTWRHALEVRSTEMNREYHLGRFAVPASAASAAKPAWLMALEARGQSMNQQYRLGSYAEPRHRTAVKTYGALAALAAALLTALVVVRTMRRTGSRLPTSA
jgi:hypothetical protein